jgi:beta-glucosidase-like glycosyl hydrolase
MNAYHDGDGVPCASDERLLTDGLRGEWGFDGTVVSDYYSVAFLRSEHGVVASERAAGVAAVEAGIDVELPFTGSCGDNLVDAAVRRVFRGKRGAGPFADTSVDAAQLAFHDGEMSLAVEAGVDELHVGPSADAAAFEVTDGTEVPRSARTYFTETALDREG